VLNLWMNDLSRGLVIVIGLIAVSNTVVGDPHFDSITKPLENPALVESTDWELRKAIVKEIIELKTEIARAREAGDWLQVEHLVTGVKYRAFVTAPFMAPIYADVENVQAAIRKDAPQLGSLHTLQEIEDAAGFKIHTVPNLAKAMIDNSVARNMLTQDAKKMLEFFGSGESNGLLGASWEKWRESNPVRYWLGKMISFGRIHTYYKPSQIRWNIFWAIVLLVTVLVTVAGLQRYVFHRK